MPKLLHADLYRCFHRLYLYLLAGVLAGICLLLNFQFRQNGNIAVEDAWMIALNQLFGYPLLIIPMLSDIVYSEEWREHTLKNTIAYGAGRGAVYFSKIVTCVFLGLFLAAAVLGVFCLSSLLLLPRGAGFNAGLVGFFFGRFAALCSVYIGSITVAAFFTIFLHRGALATFVYYAAMYLSRYLFVLLHIPQAAGYLLESQIQPIVSGSPDAVWQAVFIGAGTFAVFLAGGTVLFRRSDVD